MVKLSPRVGAMGGVIAVVACLSAAAGAIYGVVSFPDTPIFSLLRGAITGAAISLLITVFEYLIAVGVLQPVRQLPVGLLVALRSIVYTVLIIVGYEFGRLVALAPDEQIFEFDAFFWRTVWISLGVSFVVNAGLEVSRLLGAEVLWGLLIGRYLLPRVEERIVLFVDLKDSTSHAETLGDLKFHELLNQFFRDVSHAVLLTRGSIYKYNGDAAIVLWRPRRGLRNGAALRCILELQRQIEGRTEVYRRRFGIVPGFRAGLHIGKVVVGEIGDMRHEIAYSGDAMNTAARIEQATRELDVDLLLSAAVAEKLPPVQDVVLQPVGSVAIPGKAAKLALYTARWSA
ncbi:MAG: adenylate/guanylate cyclase domain-containing protein [Reyranellaceae bacterium]